jgi:hypothetical protein
MVAYLLFKRSQPKIRKRVGITNTKIMTRIIDFNEYQVAYYSQSSFPWEAAYIICFQNNGEEKPPNVGKIVFTYPQVAIPPEQKNRFEPDNFFIMYYALERFNDVVNLLRYCRSEDQNLKKSVQISANTADGIWALGYNLHVPLGAQYHV